MRLGDHWCQISISPGLCVIELINDSERVTVYFESVELIPIAKYRMREKVEKVSIESGGRNFLESVRKGIACSRRLG